MFVDISDYKSALAVENMLTPYKKGRLAQDKKTRLPKEKITPEICMEVLQSTNYARNIKDMLLCIAELPHREQAAFRDVVLAAFSNREQPNDVLVLGKKLAVANGFEEALSAAIYPQDGEFLLSGPKRALAFYAEGGHLSDRDFSEIDKLVYTGDDGLYFGHTFAPKDDDYAQPVVLPGEIEAPNCPFVNFGDESFCDGEKMRKITLAKGASVYMKGMYQLPSQLDVESVDKIVVSDRRMERYQGWKYKPDALYYETKLESFSGVVDFSGFGGIDISSCDFEPNTQIKLREGAKIHIHCQPSAFLPDNLDVSASPEVALAVDDLSNLDKLRFQKDAWVALRGVKKFPPHIDFSECAEVRLASCNVADLSQLKFKNGAKVRLEFVDGMVPADFDVSECDEVELVAADVSRVQSLRFKNGAKVKLVRLHYLPADFDVSECDEVDIDASNVSQLKNLRFKNGAKVKLTDIRLLPAYSECSNLLPENLDFSQCDEVDLSGIDFSQCDEVDLSGTNLSDLKNLHFKKGAKVKLCNAANLPPNIDFSQCAEVDLSGCDLKDQSQMKFADGAKVVFTKATNLHGDGDFSNCDAVNLERVDLKDLNALKFKSGARVILTAAQNIPLNADFSNCSFFSAQYCDLKNLPCIRFADGAEVDLSRTNSLPEIVDVSACRKVDLTSANERNTQKIIFKDAQQLEQSNIRLSSSQQFRAVILEKLSESERNSLLSQVRVAEKLNRQNAQNQQADMGNASEKSNLGGLNKLWNKMFGRGGK